MALDYPGTAIDLYGATPDVFGNAERLPFADGVFDAVACFEVLEHVEKPDRALSEIFRVLRPGGTVYLSMPFLYPIHDAPHDFQRWTEHGWVTKARDAGLDLGTIRRVGHPLHVAAVTGCLAIAGPLEKCGILELVLRAPFAAVGVTSINLLAWTISKFWPTWDAMALGYDVTLVKRA